MIDAYEIGIQLALQDDVSAGLEVIGRDLAAIDKAVAATNAGLVELARASGQAAAAAARIGVATPVKAAEASGGDSSVATVVERAVPASEAVGEASAPVAPEAVAVPVSMPAPRQGGGDSDQRAAVQPAAAPVEAKASAPQAVREIAMARVVETSAEPRVGPASEAPSALSPSGATAPSVPSSVPEAAAAPAAAPSQVRSGETRERRSIAVSSHVQARAVPVRVGRDEPNTASAPTVSVSVPSYPQAAGRSAAPVPEVEQRSYVPRVSMPSERAAAPQAAERGGEQSLSGSVMLDGRLVGYWLAEHMARETSRPPSGTSFFDPRQSPAWTASGAM